MDTSNVDILAEMLWLEMGEPYEGMTVYNCLNFTRELSCLYINLRRSRDCLFICLLVCKTRGGPCQHRLIIAMCGCRV